MMKRKFYVFAFLVFLISQLHSQAQLVDIPDANFRKALKERYPRCFVGEKLDTTSYEVKYITSLGIDGRGITDLTGIEFFKALEILICPNNQLQSLPKLPRKLKSLDVEYNLLKTLPSLPDGLTDLFCEHNKLTSLPDLPMKMIFLDCGNNFIEELPKLPDLRILFCNNNKLKTLPQLPDIMDQLFCYNNQLLTLPILPNNLWSLNCSSNNLNALPTLPVKLENLRCQNNQLTSLPTLPLKLKLLICSGNKLTALPFIPSGISSLDCRNNILDFYDIENINPSLNFSNIYLDYSPQNFFISPDTHILQIGDSLIINGEIGGSSNKYRWYKDNILISGVNSAKYIKTNISNIDVGRYSVEVRSANPRFRYESFPITSNSIKLGILTPQIIAFDPIINKVIGDGAFSLSGSSSSGLPINYVSSNPSVAIVLGNVVTIVGAGTTNITAYQSGNDTYSPAPEVTQSFKVGKGTQAISFSSLQVKIFGDVPSALSAIASSGLPVTYTSSNLSVAIVSGNIVTIVGAGSTNITASQIGNDNYYAASDVMQILTINKATQTIAFDALQDKILGDHPFVLTASTSSGLPVSYLSSNPSVVTVSGNTVTIKGPGTTNITAIQPGNESFNAAPDVIHTLTVGKAYQSIPFEKIPVKIFGDIPFIIQKTTTANLPISYTSSNPSVATILGNIVTIVGVGSTDITASQVGNENYNPAVDEVQNLTVNKATQIISFMAIPDKVIGEKSFGLLATANSGLTVSYISSNPSVATISGNTVTIVGAGSTNITAMQQGDINYNPAANIIQSLTVVKGNQNITFAALSNKVMGDVPFNLLASTSSGLPVDYKSSNPSVATISGNIITIIGVGKTDITASQAGNSNYHAASDVVQNLTVEKASQSITFSALTNKVTGDAPFTLSATSSSGLTVNYVSSDPSVATVSGNTVTITGPGTTNITASQAGNESYHAASAVSQSLTVHTVLGAEDSPIDFDIVLSPNPTDGIFELQFPKNMTTAEVNILNTSGSVIFRQKVAGITEKVKCDISHLPSGYIW